MLTQFPKLQATRTQRDQPEMQPLPRIQDPMTRVHVLDCRREVELILNAKS